MIMTYASLHANPTLWLNRALQRVSEGWLTTELGGRHILARMGVDYEKPLAYMESHSTIM